MRAALEFYMTMPLIAHGEQERVAALVCSVPRHKQAKAALSSDAGRDLLAYVEAVEALRPHMKMEFYREDSPLKLLLGLWNAAESARKKCGR